MKKSIFRIVLLAGMVVGSGIAVNAQHQKGSRDKDNSAKYEHRKMDREGHEAILDMTDEQKEKVKTLRISLLKDTGPIENELKEKKATLNTLSSAETVDKKAMEKIIEEIGELNTKLMLAREFHKQDVRAILTEEQRVFFDRKDDHKRGMRHGK